MKGRTAPTDAEHRIHRTAARQHGVVTLAQLHEAGISRGMVQRLTASGWLRRLHRGVYQVGPVMAPLGREMAVMLACGDRSALSHRSAAGLLKLRPSRGADQPVEVTVPLGSSRRRAGIRQHRRAALPPDEVVVVQGIRVTSAARTVLDLAGVEPPRELERLVAEALVQRTTRREEISRLVERHPTHPGARRLHALLSQGGDTGPIRSELEQRFDALIERAGLPKPRSNQRVLGRRRDFVWPSYRTVVEVDGYAAHTAPGRFEGDRKRDAELFAAGYRYVRFTWKTIIDEPERVIAFVAQALARAEHREEQGS